MIKILKDGKINFHNKHSSGSYDEISSIEDRIAEPKKLKVILNGTNSVGYS